MTNLVDDQFSPKLLTRVTALIYSTVSSFKTRDFFGTDTFRRLSERCVRMQFHLCLCVVTKHNIQIAWRSPAHQSLQVPRAPCQVASYVCQPTNIPSQSALSGHNKRCAHNSNSVRFRKAVKGSGRRSQQRKQGLRKCKNNNVHSVAFHASHNMCCDRPSSASRSGVWAPCRLGNEQ